MSGLLTMPIGCVHDTAGRPVKVAAADGCVRISIGHPSAHPATGDLMYLTDTQAEQLIGFLQEARSEAILQDLVMGDCDA